jgi:hypothetical protein
MRPLIGLLIVSLLSITVTPVIAQTTTTFESEEDDFRLQVPQG